MTSEARAIGAVDHAVIIGQRQRQDQARLKMLALGVIHGLETGARYAEDSHFRAIDDRREGRAADAAQARYGKAATLHFLDLELAFARLGGQLREIACNIE